MYLWLQLTYDFAMNILEDKFNIVHLPVHVLSPAA
jgi:hypothetical protein